MVKVIDFKTLALHHCRFKSWQKVWVLSCEEAIQLAYRMSVVLLGCPLVPEIVQHITEPKQKFYGVFAMALKKTN
jgi:hypothetical protein